MEDRTKFLLYGIVLVLDLSVLANLATQGMLKSGDLGVAVSSCVLVTVGLFLAMFNYEPFRTSRQQERALLRRVKDSWIETLLEITRLNPGSSLFEIGWELRDGSNGKECEHPNGTAGTHFVGPKLLDAFDDSGGFLLVLGKAGAGKTVILLELTRRLLKVAQRDPTKPIPVVLNLSTWNDSVSFVRWVRNELRIRYDISEDTSRRWLSRNRLLFLLDGLDEVKKEHRLSCVDAINVFLEESIPPGLVVCSRRREYTAIKHSLKLSRTLCISGIPEPYLAKHLPGLTKKLRHLLSKPLRLNIVSRIGVDAISDPGALSEEAINKLLFERYIDRQLETESLDLRHKARVKSWLSWLARGMKQHSQSIFLIESLQPSWMGTFDRVIYVIASRLAGTTAVMTLGVASMYFAAGVASFAGTSATNTWIYSLLGIGVEPGVLGKWLVVTCVVGGITMVCVDLLRLFRAENKCLKDTPVSENSKRTNFVKASSSVIINCLVCTVVFYLAAVILGINSARAGSGAFVYGITFGIIFWFRGRGQTWESDIRPADRLVFSLTGVPMGLGWGTLVGLVAGLFVWLIVSLVAGRNLLYLGILVALLSPLIGATLSALKKISIAEKSSPNQGIKMSLRSATLLWLFVSVLGVSAIWIYAGLAARSAKDTLDAALFFGTVLGLLFGFVYAGLDVVYHWTLRVHLRSRSYAPLRYARFLDYASDLRFLRKVGGSYVFLHGLLRDHFAEMELKSMIDSDSSYGQTANNTLQPSTVVG